MSDPERTAIEAFGVWQEKKLYGKVSMGVVRATFIIDESGVIEKVFPRAKPDTNAAEILAYLGKQPVIAVISPAKNMRRAPSPLPPSEPQFLPQARRLLAELRGYSPWRLAHEMRINDGLAQRAFTDFADMDLSQPGTPALLSYHGLQYLNLGPETLSAQELLFLQEHLRIVSGFYGLLRPLDGIWPYRLELGESCAFSARPFTAIGETPSTGRCSPPPRRWST